MLKAIALKLLCFQRMLPNEKCTEEGYFRHEEDCKKYYRCHLVDGSFWQTDYDCAPPLIVFDERIR